MKILQVVPNFTFGGAETMCENLLYALRELNHEVTAVSLYDQHTPITERLERAGIRILYLDKKLGMDVSMVPKLYRVMRQEQPDVVHTHLDVIKYAVLAARLNGIRRCVHTVHNVAEKEAEGIARKINKLYYKLGWSVPVALSPEVQKTICAVYNIDENSIPVIYNGVDLSRCIPKEDYSVGETVTLLHIGRFNEQKNHRGLLQAFQKLLEQYPGCRLNLLGDGELRADMEAYARELGIADAVCFWGNQSDVHPFLHDADLFLLPSLYEGIPMTIIEAMGTGLPIVATPVGGVPDMLQNGESGLLTACEPEAVCEACAKLIRDAQLRKHLGQKARQESVRFSAAHMAEQYCGVY